MFTIDQYFMISEYSTLGDANVSTFYDREQVETGDILGFHSTVLTMLKGSQILRSWVITNSCTESRPNKQLFY